MESNEKGVEVLRSKFLKAFAAIPLKLRNEIVALSDGEPLTWSAVYIEVAGKTVKGDKILKHMEEFGLLG